MASSFARPVSRARAVTRAAARHVAATGAVTRAAAPPAVLQARSAYSLLRGALPLERLARALAAAGYETVALADRNNLYGAVPWVATARAAGLRPLLGVELDEPGTRTVALALARGAAGYATLCQLVTLRAMTPDFTLAAACAAHHADIHILSAAPELLAGLRAILPRERLWLAVTGSTTGSGERLRGLAARLGVGIAATFPIRFITDADHDVARVLAAARRGALLGSRGDAAARIATGIVCPPAEAAAEIAAVPEALEGNRRIAADCAAELPDGIPIFPRLRLDAGETPARALRRRALAGVRVRFQRPERGAARRRLADELQVIRHLGFCEYFLVVGEVVGFARARDIPVVGRGSGASSIVAYALGITNVDPIAHRLHFERFLHARRAGDLPDLDVDLCWRGRDEVIEHVYRSYGRDRVAMISTHTSFHARSAFREAARAHGIGVERVGRLARLIPRRADHELAEVVRGAPGLRTLPWETEPWRSILRQAQGLVGLPRHLGVHPGGIVIGDRPLAELVPLEQAAKGVVVTQYEMHAIEAIGLVKIDLLGNRALSTIRDTAASLRARHPAVDLTRDTAASLRARHPAVDLTRDPAVDATLEPASAAPRAAAFDPACAPTLDAATIALLGRGATLGCFQVESPAMRQLLAMLEPRTVREVIDVLALNRPGPSSAGMKERYVRRARGLEPVTGSHPGARALLAPTYGLPLYEEDVMGLAHVVAGMPLGAADTLRRAISGAQGSAELVELGHGFVERALAAGATREQAAAVWEQMARLAAYSFSRAHAAGYGTLACQSAYLKTHHPVPFFCAVFNNHAGMYARWVHVEEARRYGVRLLLPSVVHSAGRYTEEGDGIRVGLGQVRGLSERVIDAILTTRSRAGEFSSCRDFLLRVPAAAPELVRLIQAGALDELGPSRPALLWEARLAGPGMARARRRPAGLFPDTLGGWTPPPLAALSRERELRGEMEALGISPREHPLRIVAPAAAAGLERAAAGLEHAAAGLEHAAAGLDCATGGRSGNERLPLVAAARVGEYRGRRVRLVGLVAARRTAPTRRGDTLQFVTLDDPTGLVECILLPPVYRRYGGLVAGGGALWVAGRVEGQYGGLTLRVERLGVVVGPPLALD